MPRRTGHCILDEFQTHPPQKNSAACPPHDGPARIPSKRDEFLKRDRQLSLRTLIPGSIPSSRLRTQPDDQSPARTPPPTSLFLPMRLSNSTEPKPHKRKPNFEATRRQSPAKLEFNATTLARGQKRPKILHPASQQGGVRPESSRNPPARPPQKRATSLGEAHIGPCEISVNGLSQRNFPLWNAAPRRAVLHAFSGRRAGAASRAAAA
jgi:hypothetical protein